MIIACIAFGSILALAVCGALYVRLTRSHPGSHAASKPGHGRRLPARYHRLGSVIGSLIERDPGPEPPAAITLLEDAPGETPAAGPETQEAPDPVFIPAADEVPADIELPADLDEQLAAIERPGPGEDLGEFFEAVARATGTRTGLERTAEWDPGDMTEIAAAVKEDPALIAAVRAAEDYYAELDAGHEEPVQRFEDAHREDIEAAGDTTEQDQRSYYEGAGH